MTIARAERLIVALDVPTPKEARALVERLGDSVRFYKIGLELFTAEGYFELAAWLAARGHKVFADLKLHDIPETVRRAVANLRGRGVAFLTVHGHRSVMEAAAREKGPQAPHDRADELRPEKSRRNGLRGQRRDLVLQRARTALGRAAMA
jgi:orotidine-5'-phosphate decarboxylase